MAASETATDQQMDAEPCTLSVVMPNYNHAEYIEDALHAILSQRRPPDEIILIDDGSTDDSRALIEQWASREPRIRPIYSLTNLGAIKSINLGVQAARGRYICLMAADDVAYPDFFSTALDAFGRHPGVALFCAEAIVESVDEPEKATEIRPIIRPSNQPSVFSPDQARSLLRYNDNFIIPLATVFRRDLILAEGSLDPTLGSMADGFLSRRLALKYGFCFTPQVVVKWQVRSESLSRTSARTPEAVVTLLNEARARIERDPVFPPGYAARFQRRLRFATCRLALMEASQDWDFLRDIGPSKWLDRAVLSAARKLPAKGAMYAALIWLTLRLRPYSLIAMAATSLHRRREQRAT